MNSEAAQSLQECVQEIAAIKKMLRTPSLQQGEYGNIYKNTPVEQLTTLEEIEKVVRQQMLEHISPEIGLFCQVSYWNCRR